MGSEKKIEIQCDMIELRPELGSNTFVEFSVGHIVREIINMGDGDLHTVFEDTLDAIKNYQVYLWPRADICSILRDRLEIEDNVSEALASRISSVLTDYAAEGVAMTLSVKVVEESVLVPEDDDDEMEMLNLDIDLDLEGEDGMGVIDLDLEGVDGVWIIDLDMDEHEDVGMQNLEEEYGMGMRDLDMDGYEYVMEGEEVNNIPRGSGAPKDVITRLKKEGETQARSLKTNLGSADCVVCMEQLSDSDMVINMPCSHVFHQGCIFEWLRTRNTCPLCRRVPYEYSSSKGPEPAAPK